MGRFGGLGPFGPDFLSFMVFTSAGLDCQRKRIRTVRNSTGEGAYEALSPALLT